jgi:hypothetical protein
MKFLLALVVGAAAPPVVATILETRGQAPSYGFLAVVAVAGALTWWAFLRGARAPGDLQRAA